MRPSGLFHFCLSILVPLRNRDFSPMPVKTRLNSGAVHANPYIERACCRPQRPQIPIMSSQCHRHQSYGFGWPKNTFNDCGLLAKSPYIIGSRHAHCFAIPWRVVKLHHHQTNVSSLSLSSKAPISSAVTAGFFRSSRRTASATSGIAGCRLLGASLLGLRN